MNSKDKCGTTPSGCVWKDVGLTEFGKGVCVPNSGTPVCTKCAGIFGAACNTTTCAALGTKTGACYFASPQNTVNIDLSTLPVGCVDQAEMVCRSYATAQDCVGASGSNVQVDVTYDNPSILGANRTGGTNQVLTRSDDALGLGKCAWITVASLPNGGYCVKNANGMLPVLPGLGR